MPTLSLCLGVSGLSLFYLSLTSMSGVCVRIHMYMCMYTHVYGVHSPVQTHVEARGWCRVSSPIVSLLFWDEISHWTWSLLFWLVWLASSHRMDLFPPLSPGVTGLWHHTQILLECWKSEFRTLCFCSKCFTHGALSPAQVSTFKRTIPWFVIKT